jgi:hypothetical protein
MKLIRCPGKTSQTVYIEILDSASTIGAGKTGLVYNAGSLECYYTRTKGNATAVTLATQTVTGAYSSGGFVEVSSSHQPGVYRFDIPDAAIASGVDSVVFVIRGASGMVDCRFEIDLGATGAIWDEILTGGTHNINNSAGKLLRAVAPSGTGVIYSSTLPSQSGMTSTQVKLDSGASAVDNAYQWNVFSDITGADAGDSATIISYVGSTKVATVDQAFQVQPTAGDTFEITPAAQVRVTGYISGQSPADLVLATAANKLTTDSSGRTTLAPAGLDAITTTAPSGVASNFREMLVQVWRLYFKKSVKAVSGLTIKTYADDGTTVVTTSTYTDDGAGNQTRNAAS